MPRPDNRQSASKNKTYPPGVRAFDFKTVKKLNQAQRIRLGALHSRFAGNFAKRLEVFFAY